MDTQICRQCAGSGWVVGPGDAEEMKSYSIAETCPKCHGLGWDYPAYKKLNKGESNDIEEAITQVFGKESPKDPQSLSRS